MSVGGGGSKEIDFRRLFVLSYLKVAKEQYVPKSTFEAFFPFVVAAAEPVAGSKYEPLAIAESLRKALGWPVNSDFVDLFTADLARRGFITAENAQEERFWTEAAARPSDDGSAAEIEHLQESFFAFTENVSSLFLHNVSAEDRLHALAVSLVTNRLFSIDALQEYAARGEIDIPELSPEGSSLSGKEFEYLCARFIKHTHEEDQRSFTALLALANIGVVTQLANFFHKRTDDIEQTGSPDIILDGPFLIDLIGLNGGTRRADAEIVVDSARRQSCRIGAFRHSISEAVDIVKAVRLADPTRRYGPLAAALRNKQVSEETLDGFLDDPFGIVERMELLDFFIDVKSNRNRWQEDDFTEADWQAVYAKLSGWNDLPRRRDCDSVLGIMRIRAGAATRSPWRSKCFLLTSNEGLAQYAKQACVEQNLTNYDEVGPAISRNEFAAVLWLAGDKENKNEIVTTHLLSAAQGLLARDKQMIERLVEYTENLSGDDQRLVRAIVQTEISYELLQDTTLGNPDRFTDESVGLVVQRLIEKGREEGDAAAREEETRAAQRVRERAERAEIARNEADQRANAAEQKANQALISVDEARQAHLSAQQLVEAAEVEKKKLSDQVSQILVQSQRQRDIISGLLEGAEGDWTKIWQNRLFLAKGLSSGAALLLASMVVLFTWYLRGMTTALPVLALSLLVGFLAATNDWFKSKREKKEDEVAKKWALSAMASGIVRVQKRIGLSASRIEIDFVGRVVKIKNKDEILHGKGGFDDR